MAGIPKILEAHAANIAHALMKIFYTVLIRHEYLKRDKIIIAT